jgi:succinyl-CoA synthetase alpha subunit
MDYQNGEYVDVPVIAFVGGTAAAVKYAINRLGFAGRELRSEDGNRRGQQSMLEKLGVKKA